MLQFMKSMWIYIHDGLLYIGLCIQVYCDLYHSLACHNFYWNNIYVKNTYSSSLFTSTQVEGWLDTVVQRFAASIHPSIHQIVNFQY